MKSDQSKQMTDQSLRESIKEILYIWQIHVRTDDPNEATDLTDIDVDSIIACFKEEGWKPPVTPVTKKRKCEDVHPDSEAQHGGH